MLPVKISSRKRSPVLGRDDWFHVYLKGCSSNGPIGVMPSEAHGVIIAFSFSSISFILPDGLYMYGCTAMPGNHHLPAAATVVGSSPYMENGTSLVKDIQYTSAI